MITLKINSDQVNFEDESAIQKIWGEGKHPDQITYKFKTTYEKYTGANRGSLSKSILDSVGELVDSPSKRNTGSFMRGSQAQSIAVGRSTLSNTDEPLFLKEKQLEVEHEKLMQKVAEQSDEIQDLQNKI